jgi:rubrerythrin
LKSAPKTGKTFNLLGAELGLTMGNSRFEDFLQFAIEQEQEAARLYEHSAMMAQSRSARLLLQQMASMERQHQQLLEQVALGGVGSIEPIATPADMQLVNYVIESQLTPRSSLQEVFLYAIKAEQKAASLYARLAQLELDDSCRQLFARLVQEELTHKGQLEAEFEQAFMAEN